MAVTDKVLQYGPTGPRRVPDGDIVEVGAGVSSTVGNLALDSQVGSVVIVNGGQANVDFQVSGVTQASLLVVDASADSVGLGVSSPSSLLDMAGALTVQGIAAPAVSAAGSGRLYFDSGSNRFRISENGGAYADMIVGSGTAGEVTYFSAAGVITSESAFVWDAANDRLGIGTASPNTSIEVASGQVAIPLGTAAQPSLAIVGDLNTGLWSGGPDDLRITSGGIDRVLARTTGVTLQGAVEEVVSGTGTTLEMRLRNSGAGVDEKNWAFAFDSAVNTNAFRIQTNNDALSSPVNVLAIDRSGNVGIGPGMTTPTALLNVTGGDVRFEGTTDADTFYVDFSGDRVGIGTATPVGKFNVVGDASVANVLNDRYENGASGPDYIARKGRGTASTPVIVQSGDELGSVLFEGYDGAAFQDGALIRAEVDGTPAASDMPGRMVFFTTPSGSVTPAERMRIDNAGNVIVNEDGNDSDFRIEGDTEANLFVTDAGNNRVGIGTATPAGRLEIRDDTTATNLILTKESVGAGNNDLAEFRTDAFTSGERHLFKWTSNSGALVIGRFGMDFDAVSNTIDYVWRDMFDAGATTLERMRLKGNGNLGLGVTDAAVQLDMNGAFNVRGSTAPAVSPAGQGRLYFDSTSNTWKISENGGAYQDLLAAGSIGGSGTVNQLAFFTGATTLASDADLYWNSTTNRLSIASGSSPGTEFDITGALSVRGVAAPAVSPAGEGRLYFDSGTNKWRISENGGAYQDLLGAGGVTGSGAANQVAIWNGTTVLTGEANFYWDQVNDRLGVNEAVPTSTLDVAGSVANTVTSEAASTTLDETDHTALVDASGGAVTITLPLASASVGREYRVKKTDSSSNTVTVSRSGGDTIDGATSAVLGSQYEALVFVSDGTNWFLF